LTLYIVNVRINLGGTMKKNIILLMLIFFLTACAKEEKNIAVNIYKCLDQEDCIKEKKDNEMTDKKVIFNKNQTSKNEKIEYQEQLTPVESFNDNSENEENNVYEAEKKELSEWYNENKDELKETSKEILNEDKKFIAEKVDSVKDWYYENKDDIKQVIKDTYEEEKEKLKDIYKKIKKEE